MTRIDIVQTASGLSSTTEKRCLDFVYREHKDWMYGEVRGRSCFLGPDDIDDDFLKGNWLEDDSEKVGPEGKSHVLSVAESVDNGWVARQIWGFQTVDGERRHCRNVVVVKGQERVEIRLVYDFEE